MIDYFSAVLGEPPRLLIYLRSKAILYVNSTNLPNGGDSPRRRGDRGEGRNSFCKNSLCFFLRVLGVSVVAEGGGLQDLGGEAMMARW